MKRFGLAVAVVLISSFSHASLVEYDLEGVSERGALSGYLSFDPAQATRYPDPPPEWGNTPSFLIPGKLDIAVGGTVYAGYIWQAKITKSYVDFLELAAPYSNAANTNANANFEFGMFGNFADADPETAADLSSYRWEEATAYDQPSDMSTYGEGDVGGFWFRVQKLTMRPRQGNPPIGGDAAPVPEPASMVLFGSAIAGFLGYRKLKR